MSGMNGWTQEERVRGRRVLRPLVDTLLKRPPEDRPKMVRQFCSGAFPETLQRFAEALAARLGSVNPQQRAGAAEILDVLSAFGPYTSEALRATDVVRPTSARMEYLEDAGRLLSGPLWDVLRHAFVKAGW